LRAVGAGLDDQSSGEHTMTMNDFDARAATWDDDSTKVERAQAVADAIVRSVPLASTMRAMEYGAGTGLLSFLLRPRLGQITLADVSDGMLAVAAAKIAAAKDTTMRTVKLDLVVDPVPAERYDIIYSLMTLHHIPDTDAILRRFHGALAATGLLCIADLDTEDGSFHGTGFEGTAASIAGAWARRRRRQDSRPWNSRRPTRSRRRSEAGRTAFPSS
jgi:ubiquinone/menaquinone biosynthesis C-methylase UbiE